ncbi:ketoacyl-ACP synthase III [Verrucomicrobia bacterium]|nr:ketoacyl-ACP synthase III [Verrucomicrobiota bacterium]MDA7657990.1 ketoacyl-ACP synthase III [Verrucomicrobiota bacterium]
MGIKIRAVEYHLPDRRMTNHELEDLSQGLSAQKIEAKVGIRERRIAANDETALDLALRASRKVLLDESQPVDFILLCTQSPDYFLPSGACILQQLLGLPTGVGALDFNLGCSGFVYGLALSSGLLKAGIARRILLVTADTYSKYLDPDDRANRTIFGDAAAAVIVEDDPESRDYQFVLGTDGSGFRNLIVQDGGLRSRVKEASFGTGFQSGGSCSGPFLKMNGPEIFNFTIDEIPKLFNEVLKNNSLEIDDIDYVIFHQANKFIIEYLRDKLKIPRSKFYCNLLLTGNTVSSTIPIALKETIAKGKILPGSRLLLVGFGVGYSFGACVIDL